jgi:hypothetical protein
MHNSSKSFFSRALLVTLSVLLCVFLASTTGSANSSPSPTPLVEQDNDEQWVEFGSDTNGDGRADDRDGDGKPDLFWVQLKWMGVCGGKLAWCAYTANVICLGETVFECVQTHPYRKAQ